MRSDRLADRILSSIIAPERAAAIVGDLVEHTGGRGRFWTAIARVARSSIGRDLMAAPLALAGSAAIAWGSYMALGLLLAFAGYVAVTLAWGVLYVLTHHTGLELLADLVRVRFDWPPIPAAAAYAVQAVAIWAVAPFCMGRFGGQYWRGREVAVSVMMMIVWPAMSVLVPFVAVGVGAPLAAMPLILPCVLFGALSGRRSESIDGLKHVPIAGRRGRRALR